MKAALFSVIVAMAARVACCFRNESTTSAQDGRPSDEGRRLTGRRLTTGTKYINFIIYNDYWRLKTFGGIDGRGKMEQNTEEVVKAVIRLYENTPWFDDVKIKLTMVDQEVLLKKTYPFPSVEKRGAIVPTPKVWDVNHPKYTTAVDMDELIATFGKWADDQYDDKKKNANNVNNWILMSGAWFSSKKNSSKYQGTLGYGTRGGLCTDDISQHLVRCRADDSVEACASILAHELGHNLGMAHDNIGHPEEIVRGPCLEDKEGEDPRVEYVMASHTTTPPEGVSKVYKFSECSRLYLQYFLKNHISNASRYSNVDRCMLKPANVKGHRTPFCGNGFIDDGEQCDCGKGGCAGLDKCCDETTCQFKQTSYQCSALDTCCNEDKCQFKKADTHCRNKQGECDVAEVCNGYSSTCPEDLLIYAGKKCTKPFPGVCYNGNCLSQEDTCANGKRTFGRGYVVSQGARMENDKCGEITCSKVGVVDKWYSGFGSVPYGVPCMENGMCFDGKCLETQIFRTHTAAHCGNGFIDYGEECDCGDGGDPCCDCKTCKLNSGNKCSSLDPCCTNTCEFKQSGTICQEGQCTEQKTCTGTSGICPVSTGKAAGTECTNDKGSTSTCYAGKCEKSWDDQCFALDPSYKKYNDNPVCDKIRCIVGNSIWTYGRNLDDGTKIDDDTICDDGKSRKITTPNKQCAIGSFFDSGTLVCEKCFPSCRKCSGKGSFACSECNEGSKDSRGLCPLPKIPKTVAAARGIESQNISQGSMVQGGPKKSERKEGLDGWVIPVIVSLCALGVIAAIVGFVVCRRRTSRGVTEYLVKPIPAKERSISEGCEVGVRASVPIGNLADLTKMKDYNQKMNQFKVTGPAAGELELGVSKPRS